MTNGKKMIIDLGSHSLGLAETINALREKGYVKDFNLMENCLERRGGKFLSFANEFEVDQVFRFDVMSDPDDQSVLYAIHSKKNGIKGILVNGFGIYSDAVTNEMINALELSEGKLR
jgi:hypothetical protein